MPKLGDWLSPTDKERLKSIGERHIGSEPGKIYLSKTDAFNWLAERIISRLPIRNKEVYHELWDQRRLQSEDCATIPCGVEDFTARLLTSALQARQNLMVVMPQSSQNAATLLLSTIIIMYKCEAMPKNFTPRLAYFSQTLGIRKHLSVTTVGNLNLASVFPQTWVGEDGRIPSGNRAKEPPKVSTWLPAAYGSGDIRWRPAKPLPNLICSCRPVDPIKFIRQYRPDWIVVDCSNSDYAPWLKPLIRSASEFELPVAAWSYAAASQCIADFQDVGGNIFHWSQSADIRFNASSLNQPSVNLKNLLSDTQKFEFSPLVVQDSDSEVSDKLRQAIRLIYESSDGSGGQLLRDAIRISLRCIRTLSRLCVPLSIYESESRHYWRVRSVTEQLNGLKKFAEALQRSLTNAAFIEKVSSLLGEIVSIFSEKDPPLWRGLIELIVNASKEEEKILVFPSRALRMMFSLALQARHGIAEPELAEKRITLTYINEFATRISQACSFFGDADLPLHRTLPLVVGLPDFILLDRLIPLLNFGRLEFVIYPHELGALQKRLAQFENISRIDLNANAQVIAHLLREDTPLIESEKDHFFTFGNIKVLSSTGGTIKTKPQKLTNLLTGIDPASELERIFQESPDEDLPESDNDAVCPDDSLVVESAIDVRLEGNWSINFAPKDSVQVVLANNDGNLIERKADSLRAGQKILFISGLKRQSLYDLILTRLHGMSGVEIHIALIKRWHEDLARGYSENWQSTGKGIDGLLLELQRKGSSILTLQTIRSWIKGLTHAPNDAMDLRRIAEVLDLPFVHQYYKRIHEAAHRLWGLHIGLSLRLNKMLRQESSGLVDKDDGLLDEIFDQDLGLTLRDFRDSLMLLKIQSITRLDNPVLRSSIGILRKIEGNNGE